MLGKLFRLLAVLALLVMGSASSQEKVIIDVDMGQLNDDAVAMFMLVQSNEAEVLGVTTVAGNTWIGEGVAYTLRQLEILERPDIPVFVGAREPLMGNRQPYLDAEQKLWGNVEYMGAFSRPRVDDWTDLGEGREPYGGYASIEPEDMHAAEFIARTVIENPNEVTLFILGPTTNLALAVRMWPEMIPLVKAVFYMGGAVHYPGNTNPVSEFNWWFDPEAARITLRTPFARQVVVPLDIAERVFYTKEVFDRIVGADITTGITQMYADRQGPRFDANPDAQWFVWDVLATAIFLRPEIATRLETEFIDIDVTYGPNYGKSIGYRESRNRSFASPEDFPAETQMVEILYDIDRDVFWDYYVEMMTKPTAGMR